MRQYGYQQGAKSAERTVTVLATCLLCDKCYDDRNQPTFCQEFKMRVDPRDIPGNEMRAQKCVVFKPYGFPQWAVKLGPDEMEE